MEFNDLKKQYHTYKEEIDLAIAKVLAEANFIMGPEVGELERTLSKYVGVNHCIAVSSGTDSLLIALMALGVTFGDEVITVPFTWISTAEVIKLVGAKPVFVDIDPETYLIDVSQVEALITPKTKAIIAVDLFGQIADYEALNELGKKYNIAIIQDAAQSFGAKQKGALSCSQALISSTSFFPAKTLGCFGDGGALFTNDDRLASKMKAIRTHGGESRHHHPYVGLNGRLDTLQAAILLAKFPHFDEEINKRKIIAERYNETLKTVSIIPKVSRENEHSFGYYTLRTPYRDELAEFLKTKGIPTAIYYPKCLHEQPVFKDLGYEYGDFPVSEQASREVLSLPMHPWLTVEDQDYIMDQIVAFFNKIALEV